METQNQLQSIEKLNNQNYHKDLVKYVTHDVDKEKSKYENYLKRLKDMHQHNKHTIDDHRLFQIEQKLHKKVELNDMNKMLAKMDSKTYIDF